MTRVGDGVVVDVVDSVEVEGIEVASGGTDHICPGADVVGGDYLVWVGKGVRAEKTLLGM